MERTLLLEMMDDDGGGGDGDDHSEGWRLKTEKDAYRIGLIQIPTLKTRYR